MPNEYTIPDFKTAFKKPSRTEAKVKWKEKSSLEKAVKKNDPSTFVTKSGQLYEDKPEYFVELLSYKLAKNWNNEKRDFWLNCSPPKALEAVFESSKSSIDKPIENVTQWKSVLSLENAVANRGKFGDGKDDSLRETLNKLSEEDLLTVCKAFKNRLPLTLATVNDYVVINNNLDCDNLLRAGKLFFDSEGKKGEWDELDGLLDTENLETLTERTEKLNVLYEGVRSGLKDADDGLCQQWSSALMVHVYETAAELLKKNPEKAEELFGVSNQLDKLLETKKGELGEGETEEEIKLIRQRLKAFGKETILFDLTDTPNDCGNFAEKLFKQLRVPNIFVEPVRLEEKEVPLEEKEVSLEKGKKDEKKEKDPLAEEKVKEFEEQFKSKYNDSSGVAKVKIEYNSKALCEKHYRTVVGRVGDMFFTLEANIGKKYMLAPEVMCVNVTELLCGNKEDGDRDKRIGFELKFIPTGSSKI